MTSYKQIAQYKRLFEIFPDANGSSDNCRVMLEYFYHFGEDISGDKIIKATYGKITIYRYCVKDCAVADNAQYIILTVPDKRLEFVESIPTCRLMEQYIETGKMDYQDVLKDIFDKCYQEESIIKSEIDEIKKRLMREGRLKVDPKYHKYLSEFKIDEEGYMTVKI